MLKVIPLKVSLGFVQSILPAALAVLSCCMKEPLSSKTRQGAKHPTNSRGELWQPWGKCPFTCLCLSLGLFAVRSEIGGDL